MTFPLNAISIVTNIQCSMCRAVLETGADAQTAKSLNDGIVYLMVVPYILVGIVGYVVYRYLKK